MGNLFAELKRRHIYRVAAAYAVVAWVLLQLVNNVAPVLDLPPWVARAFLLALVIGFPVAVFFAWMRELAPTDNATARAVTGKFDWCLMGALVAVIALVSYQQLAPATGPRMVQQASIANGSASTDGISVAVLPFANLSGDAGQEFFSDGMTEEITSALAKVQSLRMVARASAFQFKGEKKDMRAVGLALNARYLIDGSVRKDGNRVRIMAQLIEADTGVSIWTDSYDRELTSVFATQSDIAQAIAGALRVPLGLKPGDTLVANRTGDLDSYQQYLRARVLFRARDIDQAITVVEAVVARDPGFAPGWALLANVYGSVPSYTPGVQRGTIEDARRAIQSSQDKAEKAAREAIRLDSKQAGGYGALGYIQAQRGNWPAAEDLFRQALGLDANDADILGNYSMMLVSVGRVQESLRLREQVRKLEPFVPVYNITLAWVMQAAGQNQAAIPILETAPSVSELNYFRNAYLAQAYAAAGRYGDAAATLLAITGNQVNRRSVEDAARIIRTAPMRTTAPKALSVLEGQLSFVYFYVGALDRVFEFPERAIQLKYITASPWGLWRPEFAPVRKTERFKAFARKAGFVDYWRARGWPDLCRPVGGKDFVCD